LEVAPTGRATADRRELRIDRKRCSEVTFLMMS
jgi:hypothetical protein